MYVTLLESVVWAERSFTPLSEESGPPNQGRTRLLVGLKSLTPNFFKVALEIFEI